MADKWQIWYPHHINAWQGSATIQTFSDAAYRGYHNLIMAQFQSDDGMLPDDDAVLARESRLGPRWPEFSAEIRAALAEDTKGRIYSSTQYRLWAEAHGKHVEYLERMEAARLAKAQRKAQLNVLLNTQNNTQDDDSTTHNSVDALRETETERETERETEIKKQKHCAAASATPAAVEPVIPAEWDGQPLALETVSGELWLVPAADCPVWAAAYPGVNVLTEILKMRAWLTANPKNRKTAGGMRRFIVNWLSRAQNSSRPGGGAPMPAQSKPKTSYELAVEAQRIARQTAMRQAGLQ